MNDHKLVRYLILLLALPILLAVFSGERFRYPCQDPDNWDKDFCKVPKCDVTRTCPEHIFKGQRDPRLGPPTNGQNQTTIQPMAPISAPVLPACKPAATPTQGANCGK
jgi:hypothetical protein